MPRNTLYRRFVPRALLGVIAPVFLTLAASAQDLVIRGGHLFDSIADDVRPNTGIVIRGGKIAAVDADPAAFDLGDVKTIELTDNDYILPGIFDLHAHYNINVAGQGRVDETEHYSVIFFANGVTSTFPAGEYNPDEMRGMRMRIDRGEQIGPRVYNSGPYYGLSMRRSATAQEVYDRVDKWAAAGARGFKAKSISRVQLRALIERAHLHGLTVTGHLGSGFRNSVNPRDAILMGIDRVEHFLGGDLLPDDRSAYATLETLTEADLDTDAFREIVDLFISHNVIFDATITAYGYFGTRDDDVYEHWTDEARFLTPFVREWASGQPERRVMDQFERIYRVKQKTIKRFFDAGGTITLGTDHVCTGEYLGGFAAHRELHVLVRSGIPNAAALKIATINGARALNVADKLGTIEPRKFADLFIIHGNPLEEIRNTRNVHTVVKSGVAYDSAALLKSVEGTLGPSGPPDASDRAPTVSPNTVSRIDDF